MEKKNIKRKKCFRLFSLFIAIMVGVGLMFGRASLVYATESSEGTAGGMAEEESFESNGEASERTVEEPMRETDAESDSTAAEAAAEEWADAEEMGGMSDLQADSFPTPAISIDGNASDWSGVMEYGENPSWSIATDGNYYYILIQTTSASGSTFSISGVAAPGNALVCDWNGNVCDSWYRSISGAQRADNDVCELAVPVDYFPAEFEIAFSGVTVSSGDIQSIGALAAEEPKESGEPAGEPTEPTEPGSVSGAYDGIVIDGAFDDWSAVVKTSVDEGKGYSTVDEVAMVWDGDWVYLYFCAYGEDQGWAITGNWDSVCGAGPHNNGQYVITTDLGRETLIQLVNQNGTPAVSGISDAQVAVNNTQWDKAPHMWEVAIPASALGSYQQTISFGFYQGETLVENVADLQGSVGGEFEGIVYDGSYDDWTYYPHTLINYATSGTQETVVDAEGALYSEGTNLYGHVVTEMPAHLEEAAGEFTSAVTIKINDDTDLEFCPRFIAVDSEGNIDWNPSLSGLADGTYEFYMTSTTVDGTSKNINDLRADDVIYGKIIVTISEGKDEMEFEIDIPTMAANLHSNNGQSKETVSIDPADIKTISAQFGRIGQEWITTAGTSTLPAVSVLLCLATLSLGWLLEKKGRRSGKAGLA